MKLKKQTGRYEASNVSFHPETFEAFSYGWWKFVGIVEGKVIFNNYYYSPTTAKHQSKVRHLMSELGIKIDIEMPVPCGLPGSWRKSYLMGDTVTSEDVSLQNLIETAETYLCDKYLAQVLKRQEQYAKRKAKKAELALLPAIAKYVSPEVESNYGDN